MSKIYRFEIPFLTVCLVKNNVSHVPRGGKGGEHGRMLNTHPLNTLLSVLLEKRSVGTQIGVLVEIKRAIDSRGGFS